MPSDNEKRRILYDAKSPHKLQKPSYSRAIMLLLTQYRERLIDLRCFSVTQVQYNPEIKIIADLFGKKSIDVACDLKRMKLFGNLRKRKTVEEKNEIF